MGGTKNYKMRPSDSSDWPRVPMKVIARCVVREDDPDNPKVALSLRAYPEHDPGSPIGFLSYEPKPMWEDPRYSKNVDAVHVDEVIHICECKRCGALIKVVPQKEQATNQSDKQSK